MRWEPELDRTRSFRTPERPAARPRSKATTPHPRIAPCWPSFFIALLSSPKLVRALAFRQSPVTRRRVGGTARQSYVARDLASPGNFEAPSIASRAAHSANYEGLWSDEPT